MNHQSSFRFIVICVIASLLFVSCGKQTREITPSVEYIPYVASFTGGMVSRTSSIRVELTNDLPVVEPGVPIDKFPFVFTPSLSGKAYWIDNRTIEFVPDADALQPGCLYNAAFSLGSFIDLPAGLNAFEFSFRVIERNFTARLSDPEITADDPSVVMMTGEIRLSDVVSRSEVAAMLSAEAAGRPLQIRLDGQGDADLYTFRIPAIPRPDTDTDLLLRVDGKQAGMSQTASIKTALPARGNFRFLSAERIYSPENGIRVVFSEPLAADQDLKGLLVVPELSSYVFQAEHNRVNLYFEPTSQRTLNLSVNEGIRSAEGAKTTLAHTLSLSGQAPKPQVEIVSSGSILPDSRNLILPFRAVALRAVDVSIIRIFESNVLTFLQDNQLSSSSELRRSGRLVYRKQYRLDTDPTGDPDSWQTYSLDLSEMIRRQPGAIYRVELSFRQEYSLYNCGAADERKSLSFSDDAWTQPATPDEGLDDTAWDVPSTWYNAAYEGIDWNTYDWRQTDNPCHASYYYGKTASCNVLASNLGLIVKQNTSNRLWLAVTDILSTDPLPNVDITVYNFQLQVIATARTDAQGFAEIDPARSVPFIVVASQGEQKTYLRVPAGEENSISRFDTGGKSLQRGLKGFVYAERGVHRPGDTLHLSFILEDRERTIPEAHPVTLEVYDARGRFYAKQVSTRGINGFYTFALPTRADDPTGAWNAYLKVGGSSFHKALRIETVKPNRLKMDLRLPDDRLDATRPSVRADLRVAWLTGAVASGLKADVEMQLAKTNTSFPGYASYTFNNPATEFTSARRTIYEGTLDASGNALFSVPASDTRTAPGMLRASLTTRVFEPGGDISMLTQEIPFSPFPVYVGINAATPDDGSPIPTDSPHLFDIVTLDADGRPVNRTGLEYRIWRISWSWWWESSDTELASYVNNTSLQPEAEGTLTTVNGRAQLPFRVDSPSWGRYFVYIKDAAGGHAVGTTVYFDDTSSSGRALRRDPSGITMLPFTVDKASYEPGQTVTVTLPPAADGRALVAIENGSTILSREWVRVTSEGDTPYTFTATADMAPNVYVHVSLLQPHAQSVNDLPVRMYGIVPVFVHNPASILKPRLAMPEVLKPESEYTVTVSEADGRPMTYTLAVVDEGLLDLTRFATPSPWDEFYAREAAGIRTWDMFDDVIGAYAGSYGPLFAVGGDEMLRRPDSKANRFRPVVKFIGPFTLYANRSNTHRIRLPMYVGSVRTMLIAGQDGAYGNAEQTTPVRAPLMLLPTLPRTISVGEDILLPVNVFAMEPTVSRADITVETDGPLEIVGTHAQTLAFEAVGDKLTLFRLRAGTEAGKAVVRIAASGGGSTAHETVEIEIRNPNPAVTRVLSRQLPAGETVEIPYPAVAGDAGNYVRLELSRLPSPDLSRRMDFLRSYQHACTEQVVSAALPLLYLDRFRDVTEQERQTIRDNVREAIRTLYGRQMPNGSFAYWPGLPDADDRATSYAGMFLSLAREQGYDVNQSTLDRWRTYQRRAAQSWSPLPREMDAFSLGELRQAFRLYTLALFGTPEAGAMNRLRELTGLTDRARLQLASAYALDGKHDAARELLFRVSEELAPVPSQYASYSSRELDDALLLEALVLAGDERRAFDQALRVSRNLSSETFFGTRSTAAALMALARLADQTSGSLSATWSLDGKDQPPVASAKPLWQTDLADSPRGGTLRLSNTGQGLLFADLVTRTTLLRDTLPALSNGLSLRVDYLDASGRPLNVSRLKQGTDITARITVSNPGTAGDLRDIALTHVVPSGWEIFNERLTLSEADTLRADAAYTYRDLRDDRILTYFDLPRNRARTFEVRLNATYAGTFTLPAITCEAMYDPRTMARTAAGRVIVEP